MQRREGHGVVINNGDRAERYVCIKPGMKPNLVEAIVSVQLPYFNYTKCWLGPTCWYSNCVYWLKGLLLQLGEVHWKLYRYHHRWNSFTGEGPPKVWAKSSSYHSFHVQQTFTQASDLASGRRHGNDVVYTFKGSGCTSQACKSVSGGFWYIIVLWTSYIELKSDIL